MPNRTTLKELILNEFHCNNYAGHLGYQKILTAIKKVYYWSGMRKNIVEYLSKCLECQQVKVEHQHPTRILQTIPIPEWKWEVISLDFITGLPRTKRQNDSIMVVVDRLSKSAHFIPIKSTYKTVQIADIFMKEIFKLHGIPKTVISDWDVKFTSAFWKTLFSGLGTQIHFSTTYHP